MPEGAVQYFPIRRLDRPEVLIWGLLLSAAIHALIILTVRFIPDDRTMPYTPPVINVELSVLDAIDEVTPDPWLDAGEGAAEIGSADALMAPRTTISFDGEPDGSRHPEQGNLSAQGQGDERERDISEYFADQQEHRVASPGLRPRRIRRLYANSSLQTIETLYLNRWQRKVESVGALYFPQEIAELEGKVTVLVRMEASGKVRDVRIQGARHNPKLGEAVRQIMKHASPFPPLPDEMAAKLDLLEIVRVWEFNGAAGAYMSAPPQAGIQH